MPGSVKKVCKGCAGAFYVTHGKQEYCTPECCERSLHRVWHLEHPTVSVSATFHARLKAYAARVGRPISEIVEEIVAKELAS